MHNTREEWLQAAIKLLYPAIMQPHGYELPENLSVSCGWPKGKGTGHAIGQCWSSSLSEDNKTVHIFISPELSKPERVLDVLLHELTHAALGTGKGHGKEFKKAVKLFGLVGKATATYAAEDGPLYAMLSEFSAQLGAYPHSSLRMPRGGSGGGGGGWVRYKSPSDPSYTILISPKSLARWGAPSDPDGEEMIPVSGGDE